MDPDLLMRLEGHFLSVMAAAGGGGRTVRLSGAVAVANPRVPGAAFNFLLLRGADSERLAPVLEQGGALLAGHGRPPVVWLSPLSGDRGALRERLAQLGWRRQGAQSIMVAPLPALTAPAPARPDIAVAEVGPERLPLWLDVLTEGYQAPPHASIHIRAGWGALIKQPEARFFLATLDGEPAGTGLLYLHGQTAGLYCGAVRPHLRRRGVETALVARRMSEAAGAGASLCVLQTETGSPVERLVSTRFDFRVEGAMELWLPPAQPR